MDEKIKIVILFNTLTPFPGNCGYPRRARSFILPVDHHSHSKLHSRCSQDRMYGLNRTRNTPISVIHSIQSLIRECLRLIRNSRLYRLHSNSKLHSRCSQGRMYGLMDGILLSPLSRYYPSPLIRECLRLIRNSRLYQLRLHSKLHSRCSQGRMYGLMDGIILSPLSRYYPSPLIRECLRLIRNSRLYRLRLHSKLHSRCSQGRMYGLTDGILLSPLSRYYPSPLIRECLRLIRNSRLYQLHSIPNPIPVVVKVECMA